jgi:hypothetical protein
MKENADNPNLAERKEALNGLRVLCKVITNAAPEFVTNVTINNNRQNPVEPWNLHANDLIQLELQDEFRQQLGVYYERQENALANLSFEEKEEAGIVETKAVEMVKLAQTFLVVDGNIDKLSRMREVFEDDKLYAQVFSPQRLSSDLYRVLLCYKIHFRLRKLLSAIVEKGPSKYEYMIRARNLLWALLCQAVLNDKEVGKYVERFGTSMSMEADYTEVLSKLATTRCRFLIADLVKDPANATKAAEGNFGFLRTNTAWKRCMDFAHAKWRWVVKKLK